MTSRVIIVFMLCVYCMYRCQMMFAHELELGWSYARSNSEVLLNSTELFQKFRFKQDM